MCTSFFLYVLYFCFALFVCNDGDKLLVIVVVLDVDKVDELFVCKYVESILSFIPFITPLIIEVELILLPLLLFLLALMKFSNTLAPYRLPCQSQKGIWRGTLTGPLYYAIKLNSSCASFVKRKYYAWASFISHPCNLRSVKMTNPLTCRPSRQCKYTGCLSASMSTSRACVTFIGKSCASPLKRSAWMWISYMCINDANDCTSKVSAYGVKDTIVLMRRSYKNGKLRRVGYAPR